MTTLIANITLVDPLVLPTSAASTAYMDCHTRIPGQALLGAVAAALYSSLSPSDAWLLFHSGKLRFGDAFPLGQSGVAYPMPLSLVRRKEGAWKIRLSPNHTVLSPYAVRNECVAPADRQDRGFPAAPEEQAGEVPTQSKALRDNYLSKEWEYVEPRRQVHLRTSINPVLGVAEEGRLFGYASLDAGQRFQASLYCDADLPQALLDAVTSTLSQDLRLGRSRAAEYGRVSITLESSSPPPTPRTKDVVRIWLLSDLALFDPLAQPLIRPTAEALGFPGHRILWPQTFLRRRQWQPYNAARGGRDAARQVITAGSVISLAPESGGLGAEQLAAIQTAGLGAFREAGLGACLINPDLLDQLHPPAPPSTPATAVPNTASSSDRHRPPAPSGFTELADWAIARAGLRADTNNVETQAKTLFAAYLEQINKARFNMGLSNTDNPAVALASGPSSSLWAEVRQVVLHHPNWQDANGPLFDPQTGICRAGRAGSPWNLQIPLAKDSLSLGDWLAIELRAIKHPEAADVVIALIHAIQKALRGPVRAQAGESA